MKKIELNKNKLIFSDFFIKTIKDNPLQIIDAGGRGGIEIPWNEIDNNILKIMGFEPDYDECKKLNTKNSNQIYIPAILWSENKELEINITKDPSCSSVFEPNIELIKSFEEKHWKSKIIDKKVKYQTTTIDIESIKQNFHADFLKIDTHGAELEILKGAMQALKNDIFGVLVETWTVEVYKNQPTSDQIISLMKEIGFDLFDINIAASWKRTNMQNIKNGKKQIIGLDLLFFKNNYSIPNVQKLIKSIAIAELYGFSDYALKIIEMNIDFFNQYREILKEIKELIVKNNKKDIGWIQRVKKLILKIVGIKYYDYPKLHP